MRATPLQQSLLCKCLFQIGDNIFRVLNAHAEPEKSAVEFLGIQILPFVIFAQKDD